MDQLINYQKIIRQLLERYATFVQPNQTEHLIQLVTDDEHSQYLLINNGWINNRRNYGCFLHLSLRNHKIYVEFDGTEVGFTTYLLEAGVPPSDIVLAFHAPTKRPYTGFATA
jgi:XisI protein